MLALPKRTKDDTSSGSKQPENPEAIVAPATKVIMNALGAQHLRQQTLQKMRLQKQQALDISSDGDCTPQHSQTRPLNNTTTRLLQQLATRQLYNKLKPSAHTASRHKATRKVSQTQTAYPYKHILAQDAAQSMQSMMHALQRCGAKQRAPILAACCGHLLDDMDQETCEDARNLCNRTFPEGDQVSHEGKQWDRMWHKLAGCGADETRQQKLAMYMTHMLTVAEGTRAPAFEAHLQQLFDKIHSPHNDAEAAKSALVHVVSDQAGCGSPPQELHICIVQLTWTLE